MMASVSISTLSETRSQHSSPTVVTTWWRSGVFGEAASLTTNEADSVANAVSSSTDLPFVLGLSERDPDGVVEQARRLIDATSRPPSR